MITEVVLNRYPEDPVEIIRIIEDEPKELEEDGELIKLPVFKVQHITESRGSEDIVKEWEIVIDYEVTE